MPHGSPGWQADEPGDLFRPIIQLGPRGVRWSLGQGGAWVCLGQSSRPARPLLLEPLPVQTRVPCADPGPPCILHLPSWPARLLGWSSGGMRHEVGRTILPSLLSRGHMPVLVPCPTLLGVRQIEVSIQAPALSHCETVGKVMLPSEPGFSHL